MLLTRLVFRMAQTKLWLCCCHIHSGGSVVCVQARLSCGVSLSRCDTVDHYTSGSAVKFSAGRRVSQSDSRHILLET